MGQDGTRGHKVGLDGTRWDQVTQGRTGLAGHEEEHERTGMKKGDRNRADTEICVRG